MAIDANDLDPLSVALRVAAAIEKCGGQYFVGGSLASAFQGEPRATNDIDLAVDLPVSKITALANELQWAMGPMINRNSLEERRSRFARTAMLWF